MNVVEWMIPPLVGSIIGYLTNWLAIKMLFRPYEEKRILGIRIPFTPGLIPKEKRRLSKKVGMAVGEHLLTEEVLVDALTDERIQEELKKGIDKSLLSLQKNENTVDETLSLLLGQQKQKILQGIDTSLSGLIISQMQNTRVQDKIIELIIERIEVVMKETSLVENLAYGKELLLTKGIPYIEREEFKKQLEQWTHESLKKLEDNPNMLRDVVPEVFIDAIKGFISDQGPTIGGHIGNYLDKPDIQERIKSTIINFVNNHFGKLATMFVNVDKIYDGLIEELKKYLQDRENQEHITMVMQEYVDKVLAERVCDLIYRMPDSLKSDTIIHGIQWGIDHILTKENIALFISRAEEYIRTREEKDIIQVVKKLDPEVMDKVKGYVKKHFQIFTHEKQLEEKIQLWIKIEREKILQRQVREFADLIKPSFANSFGDILLRNLKSIVINQSSYIIQLINIPKIVEERIDSFDVQYTEQIILSIAQKELRAITWFGALLGFVMAIILNFI